MRDPDERSELLRIAAAYEEDAERLRRCFADRRLLITPSFIESVGEAKDELLEQLPTSKAVAGSCIGPAGGQ